MTKYDLFFSYNSQDHAVIEQVRAQLDQQPQALNCFIDRRSLTIGKPWLDEIQDALINSRAVAVFYGKNGLGRWQDQEIRLAMDLQASTDPATSKLLVIPILLPDADLEKAPRFLLLNTFLDLRSANWTPQLNRLVQTILGTDPLNHSLKNLDFLPLNHELRNPYRSLNYFEEHDAPLFFGREAIANKLLQKTNQCSLIALVGNSGTGKSSVVRAGLIPLLRKQFAPDPIWEVIVCIPADNNNNPFHNLAYAFLESWGNSHDEIVNKRETTEQTLRSTLKLVDFVSRTLKHSHADKLLLVIDQFEELINFASAKTDDKKDLVDTSPTPTDFELFIELLLEAIKAPKCKVLLTIRGDYYGAVTERHAGLAEKIENGTLTLTRLAENQLKDIIEKPASLGGGQLQQGLPERIIHDVGIQPGNLALLEFALTTLWNHQTNGLLTLDAYENKVGKLEGAISKKADEILYDQDKVSDPKLALAVLTRLVRVSSAEEDGGDTRQRVSLNEFSAEERICLEPFIKEHLLVASGVWHDPSDTDTQATGQKTEQNGSTLEVAHEALIRHWPTLQEALKGKREVLIWRQSIRKQFHNWLSYKEAGAAIDVQEKYLLQDPYISEGKAWLTDYPDALTQYEPEFIKQSLKFEDSRPIRDWRTRIRAKYLAWKACNNDIATFEELDQCHLQGDTLAESKNWLDNRQDELLDDEPEFIKQSLKFAELRDWRKLIQPYYTQWLQYGEPNNIIQKFKYWLTVRGLLSFNQSAEELNSKEAEFIQQSNAHWKNLQRMSRRLLRFLVSLPLFLSGAGLIYFGLLNIDTYSWQFAARAIKIRMLADSAAKVALHIPSMKPIKEGNFMMGSPEEQIKAGIAREDEGKQHPVSFKHEFFIGEYEVKASEYKVFTDDIAAHHYTCKRWPEAAPPEFHQGNWAGDEQPAIYVSWHNASCYARWLSILTGENYHLPTEAQWEYAARAGTTGDYYWDKDDAKKYAWFSENSNYQVHPVGKRDPNNSGLRDMSGNVWEWVQDCYADDYKQAPKDGSAWEPKKCQSRVLRGGSWVDGLDNLRSAYRYRRGPDLRNDDIGFRLAQD